MDWGDLLDGILWEMLGGYLFDRFHGRLLEESVRISHGGTHCGGAVGGEEG